MTRAIRSRGAKVKTTPRGKKAARVTSYEALPIKDLVIERFQVRKQNVGEELDELAASIEKYGLLQPIVVCKSAEQPGKWEIVCGQRRYLAHKQILKWPKIIAGIIEHSIEYEEGLALSASENVVRLDMTRKDLIDLCADLFKRYGTIRDVVEETKLPYPIVRKYIRFDGLPSDLQEKVNQSELNVDLAMKVQDAASATGSYNQQEANKLIKVLKTVDNPIQKKIIKLRKNNPTVSLDKIVKKAEEPDQTLKLQLVLGESLAKPLRQYAEDEDTDEKTAVEGFIETCLKENGYMDGEE
jgi:ParB family transcriptional regulator, chromosome partitioning protein